LKTLGKVRNSISDTEYKNGHQQNARQWLGWPKGVAQGWSQEILVRLQWVENLKENEEAHI
jgi:hypothetical protein